MLKTFSLVPRTSQEDGDTPQILTVFRTLSKEVLCALSVSPER